MSIRNKVVVTGNKGGRFVGTTSYSDEKYIRVFIEGIRKELEEFNSFNEEAFTFMFDIGSKPVASLLKELTPDHFRMIALCFSLYRSSEEMAWEYSIAEELNANEEVVAEVTIEPGEGD